MRIALNARVLATQELRGWSRYAVNLIDGLLQAGHEVFLFSDQPINEKLLATNTGFCQITIRQGRSYIDWEQRVLALLCKEHRIDVLHCPTNYGLPLLCGSKRVLTLHDAIEKSFYGAKKSFKDRLNPVHLKVRALHYLSQIAADRIITVSEHAKSDIVSSYGVNPRKIEVIYEGADPDFNAKNIVPFEELQRHFLNLSFPYFFYVGGLEHRKNIETMIRAWAQAPIGKHNLIIGGGSKSEIEQFQVLARELSAPVTFTGYIPQSFLPSFYAHAHCFVYPSLYEGFGLQIVESMQMGTPVICSNVTSLPEILGDPECTFDPTDIAAMATLMGRMLEPEFYEKKKSWIFKRRDDFSWQKNIQKTERVYEKITEDLL